MWGWGSMLRNIICVCVYLCVINECSGPFIMGSLWRTNTIYMKRCVLFSCVGVNTIWEMSLGVKMQGQMWKCRDSKFYDVQLCGWVSCPSIPLCVLEMFGNPTMVSNSKESSCYVLIFHVPVFNRLLLATPCVMLSFHKTNNNTANYSVISNSHLLLEALKKCLGTSQRSSG